MSRTCRKRRVARALSLCCLVVGGAGIGAPPAGAIDNGEWGVAPARTVDGEQRTSFSYDAWPNHTIGDALVVSNLTDRATRFRVYAADGGVDEQGAEFIESEADEVDGAGGWITLSPKLVDGVIEVPARSESIIPFELSVPADAVAGSSLGGLAAVRLDGEAPGDAFRVEQVVATLVRIEVAAAPPPPRLEVRDLALDGGLAWWPGGGSTEVAVRIENVGRLPATFDVFGTSESAPVSRADDVRLEPKASTLVRLTVDGSSWLGATDVALTVRPSGGAATNLAGSAMTVPVWVAIILIAAGILVSLARRRRVGKPSGEHGGDHGGSNSWKDMREGARA